MVASSPEPSIPLLSKTHRVGIATASVGFAAMGFLPLFGGPGYESALAAGLLFPPVLAVSSALDSARRPAAPRLALARGAVAGLLTLAIGFAIVVAHGGRVGFCDPVEGFLYYLLGGGTGGIVGAVWGSMVGLFVGASSSRRRLAMKAGALGLAGPLGGVGVALYRFYSSPMIFSYDPFYGFFAGTPYDTVIDAVDGLVSYRLGTAMSLAAVWAFGIAMHRVGPGKISFRPFERPATSVFGALAAMGSLAHTSSGPVLGHWQTTESIREALGRQIEGERCLVTHSSSIAPRDAKLFLGECEAHVSQVERYFEIRGPEQIEVFLFASPEEKGWLMGASRTYIAKPWRRETYLQVASYPHAVLGHELAHVVAGVFGTGPFRTAGPLAGLIPDPGRIEGIAVAASPRENGALTLQELSRAMRDLELLPPLGRVFRLSFLGEPAGRAYVVAGAFMQWLGEAHGKSVLRGWFGGAELTELTGKTLLQLETDWLASLDHLQISKAAIEVARARFDRPGVFSRKCPHIVDRIARDANNQLRRLDHEGARESFGEVLSLDENHFGAQMGQGHCSVRAGELDDAASRFSGLAKKPDIHEALRAHARTALADVELMRGRHDVAYGHYRELIEREVSEDRNRTLEVKQAGGSELGRAAVRALLVGDPELGQDLVVAAAKLGEWAREQPDNGLPNYLLGKNLWNRGRWREAAAYLDRALERRIDSVRVRREAVRTRLFVACAEGNISDAKRIFLLWQRLPIASVARARGMRRFAERCRITDPAAPSR